MLEKFLEINSFLMAIGLGGFLKIFHSIYKAVKGNKDQTFGICECSHSA